MERVTKTVGDVDKMTASESDSPMTPVESDETLEPVDVSETDHERLLFYLAGRVPVPIQELAEDTKQSAAVLREYFYEELQKEVDIDSTGFVRLMDSARNPVIRASKPYIKSGQGQFDTGQKSIDQSFFADAIDYFGRAIRIFEQIRSRLEAVNYPSEKLDQRLETAQSSIEEAQEAIGDSANRVEALFNDNRSDADANASPESSPSSSGSDARVAMLGIVRDLHKRLGRVPKTTELPEECEYTPNDFYSEFGSWYEALEVAGIDKEQELLDEIERVAEKLGCVPTSGDMDEHGTYSGSNYSTCFGSWSTALEKSGVEKNPENPREEKLKILRSLHSRLNRVPKRTDLSEECEYSRQDFYNEFGSWDEALEAVGIDKEQALLDEIERVAEKLGHVPKLTELLEECEYSQQNLYNEFGSWDEALEAAGIDKEQELLDEIERVAKKLGRVPKATEISEECEYSKYDFYNEFGSWDEVLEAAALSSMETAIKKREETEGESDGTATLTPSAPIEDITSHIDSVEPKGIKWLKSAGYTTLGDLCNVEPKVLAKHKGIGQTKATELVRFATENVSESRDASTEQSEEREPASTPSKSADATSEKLEGSATRDPATSIDEIEHHVDGVGRSGIRAVKKAGYSTVGELQDAQTAVIARCEGIGWTRAVKLMMIVTSWETWETISDDGRIDGEFLFQVRDVDRSAGNRKTARLYVQDRNGRKLAMDIWSTHDIDQEWREGEWYALENARGKVWESSDGTTRKQLSSTKDLNVDEFDVDFDPNAASFEDTSETTSEPQQSGATTDQDVPGSTPDSTTSDRHTAVTADDGGSSEDDGPEADNDGVLGDIMSDFDEI